MKLNGSDKIFKLKDMKFEFEMAGSLPLNESDQAVDCCSISLPTVLFQASQYINRSHLTKFGTRKMWKMYLNMEVFVILRA